MSAVLRGDFSDSIFDHPDFPHLALLAVSDGRIPISSFATILLYWSAIQSQGSRSGIEVVPLFFESGYVNFDAQKHILASRHYVDCPKGLILSDHEVKVLFDLMREKPLIEQVIFVMKRGPQDGISQAIFERIQLNLFNVVSEGQEMLASVGLMEAFLTLKFGDQALKMHPVLGMSTRDQIVAGLKAGQRDFVLHFPGTELPPMADDRKAPWHQLSYHDFYHLVAASGIPEEHRRVLLAIYELSISYFRRCSPDAQVFFDEWLNIIADMEMMDYFKVNSLLSANSVFWRWVTRAINEDLTKPVSQDIQMAILHEIGQLIRSCPSLDPHGFLEELKVDLAYDLQVVQDELTGESRSERIRELNEEFAKHPIHGIISAL
jgi:hypothetical protein